MEVALLWENVLIGVVEPVVVMDVLVLVLQIRPRDPSNIVFLSAAEMPHLPQRVCAKDDAPENIFTMLPTLETSQLEMSPLNDDAEANMPAMLVTLHTSHLEMSPLNDDAEENMVCMLVTLATFHLERSPLNDDAE